MIIIVKRQDELFSSLDQIGLNKAIQKHGAALIKVNLSHPPQPGHPRTDPFFISQVVQYIEENNGVCAIAEGADGYLIENMKAVGLGSLIEKSTVKIIDLDFEEFERINIGDEEHFLPKCLKDYQVRIGIPSASKRSEMVFSNNVKLFVGAVPRKMYQIGEPVGWRPRLHIELHKSVANIYRAIQRYAPFSFFINGGVAMEENRGEFKFEHILIGNNALELDQYVLKEIFKLEPPEYIMNLIEEAEKLLA